MSTNTLSTPAATAADFMAMFRAMVKEESKELFEEFKEEIMRLLFPSKPVEESDHMGMKGALEFLNSRGYKISSAQLYKLTSKSEIPYQKFEGSNRLHFFKSELEDWVNMKLIDGNAVGYLEPAMAKKGGKR